MNEKVRSRVQNKILGKNQRFYLVGRAYETGAGGQMTPGPTLC